MGGGGHFHLCGYQLPVTPPQSQLFLSSSQSVRTRWLNRMTEASALITLGLVSSSYGGWQSRGKEMRTKVLAAHHLRAVLVLTRTYLPAVLISTVNGSIGRTPYSEMSQFECHILTVYHLTLIWDFQVILCIIYFEVLDILSENNLSFSLI